MKISEHIAPFCFGYFTQYWFGTTGPMPNKPSIIDVNNNLQIAFSRKLPHEIEMAILRNGMIRFDFEKYDGGVHIYREKEIGKGVWQNPNAEETEKNEKELKIYAFRIIQIHAALLDNSRRIIEGCSSYVARPSNISEMICGYDLSDPVRDLDPDFKYWNPISDSVLENSFGYLELILKNNEGMFQIVELYTSAFKHFIESRFEVALIIYWTAIEACLNVEHSRLQPSERLKTKPSRTPQASDLLDNLLRNQKIENNLHANLTEIKNLRNLWMHNPRNSISEKQVLTARRFCEETLFQIFSIDIKETISGTGCAGGGMFRNVFSQRYPLKSNLFNRGE